MIRAILTEASPSPKGFLKRLIRVLRPSSEAMWRISRAMVFELVTSRLARATKVSGHSVVDRRVTHGVCRMNDSFCIPPESVRRQLAFLNSASVST
jgi:hypothetical protein